MKRLALTLALSAALAGGTTATAQADDTSTTPAADVASWGTGVTFIDEASWGT